MARPNEQSKVNTFRVNGISPVGIANVPRFGDLAKTLDGNIWAYIGPEPSNQTQDGYASAKQNPLNWQIIGDTVFNEGVLIKEEGVLISEDYKTTLNFVGSDVTVQNGTGASEVNIFVSASGDTTAFNLGVGEGVFKQKSGSTIELKSILQGDGVQISGSTDEVVVSADVKVVEKCGKVYFYTTIGSNTYKVEALLDTNPSVVLVGGYSVDMTNTMPDPTASVSASDLLAQAVSGSTTPYSYDLSKDGGSTWTTPNTDPNLATLVFECSDVGVVSVRVRVTGADCNSDFADVFVNVQDNMGWC